MFDHQIGQLSIVLRCRDGDHWLEILQPIELKDELNVTAFRCVTEFGVKAVDLVGPAGPGFGVQMPFGRAGLCGPGNAQCLKAPVPHVLGLAAPSAAKCRLRRQAAQAFCQSENGGQGGRLAGDQVRKIGLVITRGQSFELFAEAICYFRRAHGGQTIQHPDRAFERLRRPRA